ncbi:Translation initiation factor IF-1 [Spatholobus suberectus]|nr:Translation initiation factor IF-1 [Spatholobus suberectus]
MILVCTMIACVFVALQLFHVKRNPDMLPLISFVMLLILTLGNMISLVLKFHSLFAQNQAKKNILLANEWLELNEIAILSGNIVNVEVSRYNSSKGRIVYRLRTCTPF